jgi:hypothetical protein
LQDPPMRPHRWRRLTRAAAIPLLALVSLTAVNSSTHASAATLVTAAQVNILSTGNTHVIGHVIVRAYSNHRKQLIVCDRIGSDSLVPGLRIDPSGGGPPDTLLYTDRNGGAAPCSEYNIGYRVRKWRAELWESEGESPIRTGAWLNRPPYFPAPDF